MKRILSFCITIIALQYTLFAQICGCTDPLATNYNSMAVTNDGSCQYAATTIAPTQSYLLDNILNGTSGMFFWNGNYWTYNDHDDLHLYAIDSTSGNIIDSIAIAEGGNYDTEEISQDMDYLYFGDFGNGYGTRTDLHILKISKESLETQNIIIDTIFFSYADQTDFSYASTNTDYDCEAFIVTEDSIYLFTKQWITKATACYALSKSPGHHLVHQRGVLDVNGLITGATYIPDKQLVVLCGYNDLLSPFVFLLYDYPSDNFFAGNKRKININIPRHQVEAIATSNALQYYITNEYFQYSIVTTQPKLQILDLSPYLSHYLETSLLGISNYGFLKPKIFPNPFSDCLYIIPYETCLGTTYSLYTLTGKLLQTGMITTKKIPIQGSRLAKGSYILTIEGENGTFSFPVWKQ